jgi:hypothetical protein
MRSIFLQFAENKPDGVLCQVKELNSRVLDYAVPRILAEVKMYLTYRKDVTTLPQPLERSLNTSVKGSITLELVDL